MKRFNIKYKRPLALLLLLFTTFFCLYFSGLIDSSLFPASASQPTYETLFIGGFVISAVASLYMLFQLTAHHISQYRKLTHAYQQLNKSLESINEGFAIFDQENRLVSWNRQFELVYPLPDGELRPGISFNQIMKQLVEQEYFSHKLYSPDELLTRLNNAFLECQKGLIELTADDRYYLSSNHCIPGGGTTCIRIDISDRINMENQFREISAAIEQSPVATIILDLEGNIKYANTSYILLADCARDQLQDTLARMFFSNGSIRSKVLEKKSKAEDSRTILSSRQPWQGNLEIDCSDGEMYTFAVSLAPLSDRLNKPHGFVCIVEDITEKNEIEQKLLMAAAVFETSQQAIMVTDEENKIISVNPAFRKITGYTEAEVLDKNPLDFTADQHDEAFFSQLWKELANHRQWEGEIWSKRKNGELYPQWLSVASIVKESAQVLGYVSIFSDITPRKKAEEKIRWQANYDSLTMLPNRELFTVRLEQAIANARREEHPCALLFIDLDRFKNVNDTLGHDFGDLLLKEVAQRLQSCVRQTDTVARLGGDEFTVILSKINTEYDSAFVSNQIIQKLSETYQLESHPVHIGASIGITVFPNDANNVRDMVKNADIAMYHAKEAGKNTYRFFTSNMNASMQRRVQIEKDIRSGLENNEFFLVYQPVIEFGSNRVAGAEALLRWQHPEYINLPPSSYLSIAEDTGLIDPLGRQILEMACLQLKKWQETSQDFFISINIAASQIQLGLKVSDITDMLDKYQVAHERLSIEISENLIIDESTTAYKWITELRQNKIKLAIDNFGSGYSSLSYLKRFPLSFLKIDKNFIQNILTERDDRALVNAIITLGQQFNLKIIAKGVERESQISYLHKMGCDYLQGFHFSRPLEIRAFNHFARHYNAHHNI